MVIASPLPTCMWYRLCAHCVVRVFGWLYTVSRDGEDDEWTVKVQDVLPAEHRLILGRSHPYTHLSLRGQDQGLTRHPSEPWHGPPEQ